LGGAGRSEVRPRLATKEDVEALWASMDVIDVIATDHAPHTVEEKDSAKPPPGFPGMETALPLMLTAVNQGRITLDQVIEKMHTNPRRIFNIAEQPNTFIEVDMDEEWTIPQAMAYSKCQWTPFAGMKVMGRLRRVVLRGQVAYLDGKVLAACGTGQNAALLSPSVPTAPSFPSPASPSLPRASAPQLPRPSLPGTQSPLSGSVAGLGETSALDGPLPHRASIAGPPSAALPVALVSPAAPELLSFKGKSILTVRQFSRGDLHFLFAVTDEIRLMTKRMGSLNLLRGHVCANVFYEPSTRTSSSFWAAMVRLGGSVIPTEPGQSSIAKGESLADTVRTLASYSDVVVLRHPAVGAAQQAAHALRDIPVINAGDGVGEHPTQALLDIYTIRQELGTVNGLNVTVVGDLKNGRTVHSLVYLLSFYKVNLTYVAPPGLELPSELYAELEKKGVRQFVASDLAKVLPTTDVLYVTRIQKERFASPEEYEKLRGSYVYVRTHIIYDPVIMELTVVICVSRRITTKLLTQAKEKMIIMHPLPRVDEIHPDVDTDPRAAYFRQMSNGMYIRMALLALVLGVDLWNNSQ
jgi:carbamoyl-phosphate synthase/aspartate carbamoyltransferase/dihydroorotase